MSRKRAPYIEARATAPALKVPKSEWIELYRDLYRQTHGDDTGLAWLEDALKRREIVNLINSHR